MPLESVNFIADLNASNPADADLEAQGAAHIRNIKKALLNTFPGGNRTVGVQRIAAKTSNYTILQSDAFTTFLIDTTSGIATFLLPNLGSADSGWEVQIIKTNSGQNPLLIQPTTGVLTSGGISNLSATRRCIPGIPTRVIWTGTGFFCTRAGAAPVGSVLEYDGATLPTGFEWPNGQVLVNAATNYPDYFAVLGTGNTFDRREYVACGSSMGGASPGRLTNAISGVDSTINGDVGGNQGGTLSRSQLPNVDMMLDPIGPTASSSVAVNHPGSPPFIMGFGAGGTQFGGTGSLYEAALPNISVTTTLSGHIYLNGNVAQTLTPVVQPTIVKNFLLVVE